ncbi:MAG: hypothetical protein E6Q50_10295 [Lysobacter sp.]|nr:MAG: hypothetical protein E6Q50_10295 [Lysobacter sp.]
MSNVIQFLETMGGNAAAARMSTAEYLAAVAALDADESSRRALLARDPGMLVDALDARPFMMCMVVAPGEGNEPAESPAEDAPETPDEPPMQAS